MIVAAVSLYVIPEANMFVHMVSTILSCVYHQTRLGALASYFDRKFLISGIACLW